MDNPEGAQGNRAAGIGVQFNGDDETARTKIESYLAGSGLDRPTHTMQDLPCMNDTVLPDSGTKFRPTAGRRTGHSKTSPLPA